MNLVTGATGLIGSHVMLELLRRGKPVRATHRLSSNLELVREIFKFWEPEKGDHFFDSIVWVEADILNIYDLQQAVSGVDHVYHCAAMVSFHPRDFNQMMEVNKAGTANVVNACLKEGVNQLCYISSVAALGRYKSEGSIDEKSLWKKNPLNSHYARSKRAAELEVWRGSEEGLNVVMVNPGVVVGPGNIEESSNKIFREMKRGVPFYANGINGFVDVRDVSESMVELVLEEVTGERYVLVGENLPFRQFLNWVCDGFERPHPKYHIKPWMSALLAKVLMMKDFVFRTKSNLTPESVSNTGKTFQYDSSKIKSFLGRELRPIAPIVEQSCRFYESRL